MRRTLCVKRAKALSASDVQISLRWRKNGRLFRRGSLPIDQLSLNRQLTIQFSSNIQKSFLIAVSPLLQTLPVGNQIRTYR